MISRSLFNIEIGIRFFWLLESENKCYPDHPNLRQYIQKYVDVLCRSSDIHDLSDEYSSYVEDSESRMDRVDVFKTILRESDALHAIPPPVDPPVRRYTISPLLTHTPITKSSPSMDKLTTNDDESRDESSNDYHETWRDCFQTPPTITKPLKPRVHHSSFPTTSEDGRRDNRKVSSDLMQSFAFQSFLFASLRRASHSVFVNLNESHDQRDERLRKCLQDDFSQTEAMFQMKCPLHPQTIVLNTISYEHVTFNVTK